MVGTLETNRAAFIARLEAFGSAKIVTALVISPVLACVLALPAIGQTEHALGADVERSAEMFVQSHMGVGAPYQSLECISS